MTQPDILDALSDRQALALTAWAEARHVPRNNPNDHSPVEELIAVMVVVRNRRPRFSRWRALDDSYKAICLAPYQFSCWNPNSGRNHDALMLLARWATHPELEESPASSDVALYRECLYLAVGVMEGALQDRTGGATSYWAPRSMIPVDREPLWAAQLPRVQIGDQIFVRNG